MSVNDVECLWMVQDVRIKKTKEKTVVLYKKEKVQVCHM